MNEKLAEIELLSYSIKAESLDKSDTMVFLTKMGLPLDIATRLLYRLLVFHGELAS